ncbi:MAG: TRAP transporter small permease subunit [Minwuia sp.]|uniref:TRAP transporter small permease subunit n=1 Tax=Minwuia sp. TaxID=2493630 RepID=UPI003A8A00AA
MDRLKSIDRISGWLSVISSWTLLAMTLIVGFEVASRYLFNSPTIWAWDINVQLMLLLLMFGISEAYRRDVHVRVDILTGALSPRGRAIVDALYAPVFFLITVIVVWTGWEYFHQAFERNQTAPTILAPLLWPIKFTIPLGGAVLLLQGLAKLIRDLHVAFGGEPEASEDRT